MKSLPSSRREVLVDCFHVYTYHIGYLLPGSAVLQHSAALLHHIFSHYPATATDSPLLPRCGQPSTGSLHYQFALHFRQRAHDMEKEASGGSADINALGGKGRMCAAPFQRGLNLTLFT